MSLRPISPRPMRFFAGVAHIELTQGYVAKLDAADAYLVADFPWYALPSKDGVRVYAVSNAISDATGTRSRHHMHRVIKDAPDGLVVDHRDGDGLNNCRSNLRLANKAENAWNRRVHRNNKSGVKGVHWNDRDKRWIATIMQNRKSFRLGSFTELEEARAAYLAAAAELHGDFKWGAENGVEWSEPKQEAAA